MTIYYCTNVFLTNIIVYDYRVFMYPVFSIFFTHTRSSSPVGEKMLARFLRPCPLYRIRFVTVLFFYVCIHLCLLLSVLPFFALPFLLIDNNVYRLFTYV